MSGPSREQALSLLADANNHGDLAVKLSSLRQAKDILFSLEPSLAAELLPYLADLHSSPDSLVRKVLIEMIEEIGLTAMEHSLILMPVLVTLLRDNDVFVARKSIIAGTHIFCRVLEELALQFHRRGIVERWLEEMWSWMVKFKDAVFSILLAAGSIGTRLLAMKFLETSVLLFTSDTNDSEILLSETKTFSISWLVGGHPILDPASLMSEANRSFGILMDLFRSSSNLPVTLMISVVNCLAAIARKRTFYYSSVLSALLDFDPSMEMTKGGHIASVHYSLRTAFLGFLRCTYPPISESRDRLIRSLRSMNAGDAADQVLRQVGKMLRNSERASRDARYSKDEPPSNHMHASSEFSKKRSTIQLDHEEPTNNYDFPAKKMRYTPNTKSVSESANGVKPKVPSLDANLTPVEQMIAMMSALMAEGERGAESLAILISNIHPDLLADIVIANMKYLPKSSPPLVLRNGAHSANHQSDLPAGPPHVGPISVVAPSVVPAQVPISSLPETSVFSTDSKRDPRRDPRRFDPRRPVAVPAHVGEDNSNSVELEPGASSIPLNRSPENTPILENEIGLYALESPAVSRTDELAHAEEVLDKIDDTTARDSEEVVDRHIQLPILEVEQGFVAPIFSDFPIAKDTYSYSPEPEEISQLMITDSVIEEISYPELPPVPLYIDMPEEQKRSMRKMAVERIINSHKHMRGMDYHSQTRMTLLARLVAQIDDDDDVVVMMQKHIISDYQQQKGHELVMHVLYHLYTLTILDSESQPSFAAVVYEKFLLGVARALLDSFPATDKSFSRLLGEVPFLPQSAFELLDEICCSEGKDLSDGDRVTQGLGAVWSLILGRPINRQACLDIALKAAVLLQDDIRAKAIRLVANKLYMINYIAEDVEQFATNMLLSAVGSTAQKTEAEIGNQETSTSGSQISEAGNSENDPAKGPQAESQSDSSVSFADAQRHISLYFALCIKKPCLLQLVFDNYAHAPKAVKQAVHRHIPVLVRALGSSYSELLHIITDPPQGSEPLLSQVLQILSEGMIPSGELVATVKRLYETKLKDATILIPILSSFSKAEVLPIFPRLVELALEKFQIALAHILQGSAHTGPALTPAEVLVAIHAISPEKDGLPLKKITDVCSACFEQRTVFTQQVLAKALNQMVDQTPLPLLFMRTVIQAIDAFPALVDVVMEILSKLVSKQIWRMPKLWVGFLKCVSQTQPHSFRVLLQLPPQQLEGTLNKYSNLRGPLASYANQPSVKSSLSRPNLILLGLTSENHDHHPQSSLHSSDKNSSSVHGLT